MAAKFLAIVRTPFQAWLLKRVLRYEGVSRYDLIYFTQNDSEEDRYYFDLLKSNASDYDYLAVAPRGPDIWSHIRFRWRARVWCVDRRYEKVFLASIDAHVPNAIAAAQSRAELITFDDGTANIFALSNYYRASWPMREVVYRKALGASNLESLKERVARHYTLYANFDNIVEKPRLRYIDGCFAPGGDDTSDHIKTFFIGGPFAEVFTPVQIGEFELHLRGLPIDCYVRHPRERTMLDIGVEPLEKQGRIAEDAIVENANGANIHLVGAFSTVLFNLGGLAQRRTMICFANQKNAASMVTMAKQAGCEVITL